MPNLEFDQNPNYSYLPELVGHLVGLAHLRAKELWLEQQSSLKLTPKQVVALEFISHNPGVSQNIIAKHIGTAPTVMVGILDVLTVRGFVERLQSETDRRHWHVRVTKQGKKILAELKRLMFEVEKVLQTESGLNQKDWNTLQKLLRKLTSRG